ncbi:hypothetical protein SS1G_13888 [Sclerotinia sclerotiorum 1980 UF-70]|uniref:Uncharacterized protein n=1 Tax=Sclerotinia sclerotiorum (strain ATCC 18683 / 1980 / Ss-1) TaxID=665079 RepID=A7F8F7_SCLS1|nr:hypothetical protein SS1G_13888 [Sclerotinia sclerotiorum 1980 UF-70]EDN99028.1 hypothetical protein SS1G_13888 [Sclerotinia sclerotiorum 1980 UF-70]
MSRLLAFWIASFGELIWGSEWLGGRLRLLLNWSVGRLIGDLNGSSELKVLHWVGKWKGWKGVGLERDEWRAIASFMGLFSVVHLAWSA